MRKKREASSEKRASLRKRWGLVVPPTLSLVQTLVTRFLPFRPGIVKVQLEIAIGGSKSFGAFREWLRRIKDVNTVLPFTVARKNYF